jgi:hypothetical protein
MNKIISLPLSHLSMHYECTAETSLLATSLLHRVAWPSTTSCLSARSISPTSPRSRSARRRGAKDEEGKYKSWRWCLSVNLLLAGWPSSIDVQQCGPCWHGPWRARHGTDHAGLGTARITYRAMPCRPACRCLCPSTARPGPNRAVPCRWPGRPYSIVPPAGPITANSYTQLWPTSSQAIDYPNYTLAWGSEQLKAKSQITPELHSI